MRIIRVADLAGAARDFVGDGLSFDNYDQLPDFGELEEGSGVSPVESSSEREAKEEAPPAPPRKRLRAGGVYRPNPVS